MAEQRPIKFRVWDGNDLYLVDLYWFEENFVRDWPDPDQAMLRDHVLMQFTGLPDADGREIYEGDILAHTPRHGEPFVGVVQYVAPTFWLFAVAGPNREESQWSLGHCVEDGARVVGNIYENPDIIGA